MRESVTDTRQQRILGALLDRAASENPGVMSLTIYRQISKTNRISSVITSGLPKSLARRPGAIVFSSRATKIYHRPARRDILNTGQGVFFKYVKWYKNSLNCNFKRSYSWGWKGKNRDMAGFNFKRQLCHWINMSAARFKVKTRHGCLCVNVLLKGTDCPQKRVVGIFI